MGVPPLVWTGRTNRRNKRRFRTWACSSIGRSLFHPAGLSVVHDLRSAAFKCHPAPASTFLRFTPLPGVGWVRYRSAGGDQMASARAHVRSSPVCSTHFFPALLAETFSGPFLLFEVLIPSLCNPVIFFEVPTVTLVAYLV